MTSISADIILANPVAADAALESAYLGNNMDQICDAAFSACDQVLIANSALPLENRRAAFQNWRKKRFLEWLQRDPFFKRFYDSAEIEMRAEIIEGLKPLAEVARLVSVFRQAAEDLRNAAITEAKERLRRSVLSRILDCGENEQRLLAPRFVAILESGEVGLFRHRAACVEWARGSGESYMVCPCDLGGHWVHYVSPCD